MPSSYGLAVSTAIAVHPVISARRHQKEIDKMLRPIESNGIPLKIRAEPTKSIGRVGNF